MRIIKFSNGNTKKIVLALGNFDGVHHGHKKLIQKAVSYAGKNDLTCYAMTFEPHPQQVISKEKNFQLLTTPNERINLMSSLRVDGVVIKKFDKNTRKMSPENFIKSFLVKGLNVKKVFVGYDFAFGRKRSGNVAMLEKMGKKLGFSVEVIKPVKHKGTVVKSSNIRKMIIYGKFNEAVSVLGHSYLINGRVISGTGTGRKLGFPTANISLDPDKLMPGYGVYIGYTYIAHKRRKCVINIGSRPTFSGSFAIEVHVLGYNGRLNGIRICVELVKKLRDEKTFSSINALKEQIRKDIKAAKKIKK